MPEAKTALVTGGNRGIGLEVCRQLARLGHVVFLGSRDLQKGKRATDDLRRQGLVVHPIELDVTDGADRAQARTFVESEVGRLDVLINNAAILYDTWQHAVDADLDTVRRAFETNVYAPWCMVQDFLPLLRASRFARIVNVSSEAGSLTSMTGGTPAYSLSKAALNALTRMLADGLRGTGILVNAVCPGWVETDMGGPGGRPVEQGAASVVWGATLQDGGPTGGFFRDGDLLAW